LNYEINDKVFSKLNDIELIKMGKKIEEKYPYVVLNAFPDKILNVDEAISHLMKATNLDESVIRNCLSELIDRKELIPSKDSKGNLFLSKMRKIY
jgi:hypothetical protein